MRVECFISYSREDREIALQIISLLRKQGIEPWWDEKISLTTDDFTQDIEDALSDCQCFLVIWTSKSVRSKWVRKEANFIQNKEIGHEKIVSISVGVKTIPLLVSTHQNIDITLNTKSEIKDTDKIKILSAVKSRIGIIGKNEHVIHPRALGETWGCRDLAIEGPVPGTDLLLSFRPCGKSGVFLIMHFKTTDGWVPENIPSAKQRHEFLANDLECEYVDDNKNRIIKIRNDVHFIKDPIRPYSIQIGGIRSARPNAEPGIIEGTMNIGELGHLPTQIFWLSLTLAEILTNEDTLKALYKLIERYTDDWGWDKYRQVKEAIARNPFSPIEIQKSACRFCNDLFKKKRRLYTEYGVTLIANDFPYGPNFHYIAILDDAIHSWEEVEYKHLFGINKITHKYLSDGKNRSNAVGLEYGFNSSIRHLVLGTKTHSSAGASIPHVHKQIWGMAPHTSNLAEQLIVVSEAYSNINIDYLKCYINALRDADYVVWEDEHKQVVLYVPYGQCSLHELQIMIMRPCGTYIDLNEEELDSLSKAEFIVFQIYKRLGITSFNSILITKLFNDMRAPDFRVIQTFVTREIDLAVSELSTLYVVDQHPNESKNQIKQVYSEIEKEVLEVIS